MTKSTEWIYINNPDNSINDNEHLKNFEVVMQTIADYSSLDIWVAFGNHIYDRKYLPFCFKDIYSKLPKSKIKWFTTGLNKSGAPKHPLYQKNESILIGFDMESYIKTL